ncbi:TPA: type II toxin-antitoxin system PemK/MazF family toxin [Morganella morganii]
MERTVICYYKKDKLSACEFNEPELLGREVHENINEFILPVNRKNTPFFITRKFSNQESTRWKVEYVIGSVSQKGVYEIYLSEKDIETDIYLNETAKKVKKPFWGIVKKGAIVIVEFGHIYQLTNLSGEIKNTYSYPCYHQNGEMHKRRPAIVVSADRHGVKIVPVTSQKPDSCPVNKSVFKLDESSVEFISDFLKDKESYVLCEMIQTVSPARILPPHAKNRSAYKFFRDEKYTRKIIRSDIWKLEEALLSSIGLPDLREEYANNKKRADSLESDNKISEDKLKKIHLENNELNKKLHILKQLYMVTSDNVSEAMIDQEINEYLSID